MAYVSTKLKHDIVIDEIITIHYLEYGRDFFFRGETHDFWEFLYVDKGCVLVRAAQDEYQLNAGDIIFHQPNEFHAIRAIGDKAPNLVAISFYCTSPAINFFVRRCCTLQMDERQFISNIISEAKATFQTPLHIPQIEQVQISPYAQFGAEQLISNYLELFLIQFIRNHSETEVQKLNHSPIPPVNTMSKSERFEQIIQFLEFNICEHLTVKDICIASSLSRSSLQTLFKKEKGCGVIDYFSHMKIERAREIIRDGKMNFTEIAHFLSYSSLQYFSMQFKKLTGMSPLEYSSSIKGITDAVKEGIPRSF